LGGHEGGFFAHCVTEDGLNVLIAALIGFPMGVSEGLWDLVDVDLFDESLVSVGFGG
jgi:hypothetical protein